MPHPLNRDNQHRIVDRINDPVISDPNSKSVIAAVEFAAARDRSRDFRLHAARVVERRDEAVPSLSSPTGETQRRSAPFFFKRRFTSTKGMIGSFFRRAMTARSFKSCNSSSY
jgi:hypothetical protein